MTRYAVAFVAGAIGYLVACTDLRDRALVSLADARVTADRFAEEMHSRCTLGYAGAITREDVARLDAVCLPARARLADYRDAWVALAIATQGDATDEEIRQAIGVLKARRAVLAWPAPH